LFYEDPVKVDSSPIFFAIKQGNLKIAEMILDHGGPSLFNARNSLGYTPMTYASSLNQHDIVNHLSLRGHYLN
jgi:ankyrin repeat protein